MANIRHHGVNSHSRGGQPGGLDFYDKMLYSEYPDDAKVLHVLLQDNPEQVTIFPGWHQPPDCLLPLTEDKDLDLAA